MQGVAFRCSQDRWLRSLGQYSCSALPLGIGCRRAFRAWGSVVMYVVTDVASVAHFFVRFGALR